MKVGAVGLGNRAAHVFFELKKINPNYSLVAFVDQHLLAGNSKHS